MDSADDDDGCAEPEPEPEEGEGAECGCGCDRGGATLGMNDVTTATGCAVSRRRARIFWERPRALILLAARSKEDQRFAVASATARRDMGCGPVPLRFHQLMFVLVRDILVDTNNSDSNDISQSRRRNLYCALDKDNKDMNAMITGTASLPPPFGHTHRLSCPSHSPEEYIHSLSSSGSPFSVQKLFSASGMEAYIRTALGRPICLFQ